MAETEHGIYFIEEISDGAYKIYERRDATMYLVCGTSKAVLIDTAFGVCNLKELAAEYTNLPVDVVNTHGHIDHVLGNHWFNGGKVYMHHDDIPLYKENADEYVEMFNSPEVHEEYGELLDGFDPSKVVFPETVDIREGDVIDLGGKKLEIVEMPGHTPGSIILIDRDAKICYAGDSIIENTWLFLEESLPLEVYLNSLKKVNKILKDTGIEKIYNGHFCYNPIAVTKLDDIIAGVESIIAGTATGESFESHAGSGIEYPFDGFKVLYRN